MKNSKIKSNYSDKIVDFCNALNDGKICLFETDTVVGIGCLPEFLPSVNKIFNIKGRPRDKKLPWLVSNQSMLGQFCGKLDERTYKIMDESWPGSTTLILKANDSINECFTVNHTIAFRCPAVDYLIDVMNSVDSPIVCTSANLSGENTVTKIYDVNKNLVNKVDFVFTKSIDSATGNASKIIDCTSADYKILR